MNSTFFAKFGIGAVVIIAVGLILFNFNEIFREVSLTENETKNSALEQQRTIGISFFRQQADAVVALKEGLAELGYKNIVYKEVEVVIGPTMMVDIEKNMKQFLNEDVDLIFAPLEHHGISAVKLTEKLGNNTPIVFLSNFHDPVEYGLAASFESSRNNATGVSLNIVEVVQKQLEFLGKANPSIKKIGVFSEGYMAPGVGEEFYAELLAQAPRFGYTVVEYKTKLPPPEAEKAWKAAASGIKIGDIDAIYHIAGHYYETQEAAEGELATRLKVFMMAPTEDLPNGGHMAYSGDYAAAAKQSTVMIDKIFRGVKPSEIPIEYLEGVVLHVHLERIKKAGLVLPDTVINVADKILKDN